MTKNQRLLLTFSAIVGILVGLGLASPASADVPLPVQGSLTVTEPGTQTPITLIAGTPSTPAPTPEMTYTAFGIGLSGFPYSTNFAAEIQVRPSTGVLWTAGGWTPKVGCPTTSGSATTALANCGITAVYINETNVTSNAKVYVDIAVDMNNLLPSGQPNPNYLKGIPNTFIIKSVNGNFISDVDAVGTVRVELDEGAWTLADGADTTRGFGMWVRSATTSQQGTAFSTTRSVVFNPNGGTGNPYTQTWTTNATRALSPNLFTRSGYTLSAWTTEQDGTGDSYAPGADYTFATNQNLYAQWTANSGPSPAPNPQPTPSGGETLANTGSTAWANVGAALSALMLGSALLLWRRKRSAR